jgi:GTP-binding protein
MPEVCFAGRSNVGKSSLINALINHKNFARTSNQPGKTQTMNYYLIDERCYFVDLPGYGFAKVPKEERERWGRDIRDYLLNRSTLELIIHVVDARHKPTQLDEDFIYWMATNRLPFSIFMSKSDKLSNNKRIQSEKRLDSILEEMNIEIPVLCGSAQSRRNIRELQKLINEFAV